MLSFPDEFPQAPGLRYLNHAAVAPWPARSRDALQRFAAENCQLCARDYPRWMGIELRLRQRLQRLLNAPSVEDIGLLKNTSEALSVVAFGIDWRPGDEVLISDQEFPSNRIVWEALAPRGVQVRVVSLDGSDPEQDLLDACGPRTRLLSISAVQYASGLRLDLPRLGQGLRQRGVLYCIDAIQHLGALPFDVQAYNCDFAMADGHKWLLGPEGLAVFYCRAERREQLQLQQFGWHMVEQLGDYQRQEWQPAHSARRFECGSPNMLGAVTLEASLSLLEEIGMAQVATQLEQRMDYLQQGLQAIPGLHLHSPLHAERRAGILNFTLQGWDNATLFEQLRQQQVVCAQRGTGIRLSPHFYTPVEVLDDTLALLRQWASRG